MGAQQQAKGGRAWALLPRGDSFSQQKPWSCGGPERPFALQLGAVPDPDASVSAC